MTIINHMVVKDNRSSGLTLSGANQFTASFEPNNRDWVNLKCIATDIIGSWPDWDESHALITLQRSINGGGDWDDYETFTHNIEAGLVDATAGVLYRLGCKSGDYVAGSINLKIFG